MTDVQESLPLSATAGLDSESEAAECIICYEVPTTYGVIDSCSHVFCYPCIRTWENRKEATDGAQGPLTEKVLQSRSACPVCRRPFKVLFPTPTLLIDENDRQEALKTYMKMLGSTPCPELVKSPRHRRYCSRGIDCLYSHTLELGPGRSETYVFTHTHLTHLLIQSQLRSELTAKRILSALFQFALTFPPFTIDRESYVLALAREFERIQSRLTREEIEDPEVWRIVEEVQGMAEAFGMGLVVSDRMERLGRDPRWRGDEEGFAREWVTDSEYSEDEEEEEEVDESEGGDNQSWVSSNDSLPVLEDIDHDDEPPFPRSNNHVPASATFGAREHSSNDNGDLDQELIDRLVQTYRNTLSLDRSDDEDEYGYSEDESEEESDVDSDEESSEEEEPAPSSDRQQFLDLISTPRRPPSPLPPPRSITTILDHAGIGRLPSTPRPHFASFFQPGLTRSTTSWTDVIPFRLSRGQRNSGRTNSSDLVTSSFGNWLRRLPPFESDRRRQQRSSRGDSIDAYSQHELSSSNSSSPSSSSSSSSSLSEEEESLPPNPFDPVPLLLARTLRQLLLSLLLSSRIPSPSPSTPLPNLLRLVFTIPPISVTPVPSRMKIFLDVLEDLGIREGIQRDAGELMYRMWEGEGYGAFGDEEDPWDFSSDEDEDYYDSDEEEGEDELIMVRERPRAQEEGEEDQLSFTENEIRGWMRARNEENVAMSR
ncbi:uncharacterized protein JCM6883_003607 [Sporobolomyces salmoneus]|uniref:uncharacterized protein n=1 Tax=Sporobolomyces salmoneus TaxID=183962 RepID=UPI003176EC25